MFQKAHPNQANVTIGIFNSMCDVDTTIQLPVKGATDAVCVANLAPDEHYMYL